MKHKKPRYFYGWNIVAASFIANLSYSEQYSSILGLFFKPLQNQFGWTRSAIAAVQTIARLVEATFAPVIGPYIDRYGPRVLMPIGAVIVGLAMIGITQITAIWHFYLLRGVAVAIGFAFMGQLMTSVTISKWFIHKRGRALAISRIGSNASNVITIPLATYVIAAYGWQAMFGIFGLATWVFVLVPSAILMRRRPEDMGLYPDGIKPGILEKQNREEKKEIKDESFDSEERSWSRREVMMTASFWMLSLCFGINSLAFQGINISLAPYVQDLGYDDVMLNMVLMFRAIFGAVYLPLIGFLAEHTNRLFVRLSPFIIQAIGALFFIAAGNVHYLWLGVAAYILGGTAVQIIQDVILADYFGRPSLGTVRSLAFFIGYGFGSVGPIAMNGVYDILGSYELAFIAIMCLFILSAIVMSMVHPPKKGNVTPAFKTQKTGVTH